MTQNGVVNTLKINRLSVDHYDIQAFVPHGDGQIDRKGFAWGVKGEAAAIAEIVNFWLSGYMVYVLAFNSRGDSREVTVALSFVK